IVAQLGQRALEGIDLPTLLDEAVSAVARNLEIEFSRIMELDPERNVLRMRAGFGWTHDDSASIAIRASDRAFSSCGLGGTEPIVAEALPGDPRFVMSPFLRAHDVASGLCVSIHGRDRPFGILEAFSRKQRMFATDDANFVRAVAHVLATAIQRKRDE